MFQAVTGSPVVHGYGLKGRKGMDAMNTKRARKKKSSDLLFQVLIRIKMQAPLVRPIRKQLVA